MSEDNGPPVLIGEKVWWLGSGSGLPKRGVVRWIGRLPEIGPDWALGIELEECLPYGGVDGNWRGRELFKCKPKHGLIVPSDKVLAQLSGTGSQKNSPRRDAALSPFQNQVAAPPRLKRQSLLLDRHSDFHSVHLEAVQIRRRLRQQNQVISLYLGQSSGSSEDDVLSRGMTRTGSSSEVVPRTHRTESLATRKEKTNSGLFSFLRWFRKENKPDKGEERSSFSNPGSPVLRRSDSAVTGSIDTLFSTATVTSFAYVRPETYRPFGEASEPEKWIYPGPETNTYLDRLRKRDEISSLNQNLSLRKKYNLFASGSLGRSLDDIVDDRATGSLECLEPGERYSSTLARKKRKAPSPPAQTDSTLSLTGCDSLPTTLSKESLDDFKLHRRTVSESAKYLKKPFHVKGKRKAPQPPNSELVESNCASDVEHSIANTLRKKRKAPPPPIDCRAGTVINIGKESSLDIVENEQLRLQASNFRNPIPSTSKNIDQEVESISSTDTLRLEKGILKPNKTDTEFVEPKAAPMSPVSPRPWYKRPQSSGSSPKQSDWKKKESKSVEDWMPESAFARRSQALLKDSKFSIFGKSEKPDDKRRSQISILTNISELDREAAEIIQRGKEREKSLLASYNEKYYVNSSMNDSEKLLRVKIDEGSQTDDVQRKATAKELISLFNSITNASRVVLNSQIAAHDNNEVSNDRNVGNATGNTRPVVPLINDKMPSDELNGTPQKLSLSESKTESQPGPSGKLELNEKLNVSRNVSKNLAQESKISRVTIEEMDEYDTEKIVTPIYAEVSKKTTNAISGNSGMNGNSESSLKSSSGSTICSSLLNDSSSSLSSGSNSGAKIKASPLFSNSPIQKKLSVWICSRCTLENPRWRLTCEACDMWRPTVCDYKRCKKPTIINDQTELLSGITGLTYKIESEAIPQTTVKELDKATKNLIMNGQVLSSINTYKNHQSSTVSTNLNVSKPMDKELTNHNHATNIGTKQKPPNDENITEPVEVDSVPTTSTNSSDSLEQAEIVRKARIAFFNKTDEEINKKDSSSNTDIESANNMDNVSKATTSEKLKLRELLKEMKNSLPKQKKHLNYISSSSQSISDEYSKPKNFDKGVILKQNSLDETPLGIDKITNRKTYFDNRKALNKSLLDSQKDINKRHINEDNKLTSTDTKINNDTKQTNFSNKRVSINDLKTKTFVKNDSCLDSTTTNCKPVIVDTVVKPAVSGSSKITDPVKINIKSDNISKQTKDKSELKTNNEIRTKEDNKKEAILIKSEITIEEIKVRKPEKVSSSAQTSTKVLSLDGNSKNNSENEEVIIPVTIEEYTLKDGGLKSSIRVEPIKAEVKKFEHMRPRDFTNIKSPSESSSDSRINQNSTRSASTSSSDSSLQDLNDSELDLQPGPSTSKGDNSSIGTLALNRLLRRLEHAIRGGQHDVAALLAKELARLKVPCTVVRHSPPSNGDSPSFLMKVLVEDKTKQWGPIAISVTHDLKLVDLKKSVEKEHGIASHLQRWFIDKKLASDDDANLKKLGVEGPFSPIFLYIKAEEAVKEIAIVDKEKIHNNCSIDQPKEKIQNNCSIDQPKEKIQNNCSIDQPKEKIQNKCSDQPEQKSLQSDQSATLPSSQLTGWKCSSCNLINRREEKQCRICNKNQNGANYVPDTKHLDGDEAASSSKVPNDIPRRDLPSTSNQVVDRERQENYQKLVDLEKNELALSIVPFECPVCFTECLPPDGVVLKECLHSFCRGCLSKTVEYNEEAEVKCPYRDDTYTCHSSLLEREIKALVTEQIYEQHLAKSIAQAETKIANAFHCKTPDCKGWCIYEDNVNLFKCPVCLHFNCLTCQAIHEGLNCQQYQEQLNQDSEINLDAKRTKDMLQEMVDRGEAMPCPRCKVVLMKKWGCDWLRCSMCKTEICWVTRGPRWGPNGKGDTSGGCQCGVNGIKCHPKCNYCH